MSSPITTHVLDTSIGRPASGIPVSLFRRDGQVETQVGSGVTDDDGRIMADLINTDDFQPGAYRIRFSTQVYFDRMGCKTFYPDVEIIFLVSPGEKHYHVPLLLSPFGYSTYRGS